MSAEQQMYAKRFLPQYVSEDEYLAVVTEFDGLWGSAQPPVKQERMDELMTLILAFEAQFPSKD